MTAQNYIDFLEIPNSEHKTRKWLIRNINTNVYLGQVYWRTGFRKYVFSPDISIQLDFDASCLKKIFEFIDYQTDKHYAQLNK